jgi:carbamoyltransferase
MGYIIGISAFYHDSSVCLFKNDQLVFACEEEKFSGIKHDHRFPEKTLDYIYEKYKLNSSNIEAVCFYEQPTLKLDRVKKNSLKYFFKNPIYSIKSYFKARHNFIELDNRLKEISNNVFYSNHHESHIYYSYYTSYFKDAIVLSVDGVGEYDTTTYSVFKNGIKNKYTISGYPHSLGLFYSAMTSFLGFKPNEGEYKMMGLASYGNPNKFIDGVRRLIKFENGGVVTNMDVFCWDHSDILMFNENLPNVLNVEQRLPEEEITQDHKDLAASVQKCYEEILFEIITLLKNKTGIENLCMAGGCAYNGTANGKILDETEIKHLWIPPAPSDEGSAIGACLNFLDKHKRLNNKITRNPFLGPEFYEQDILQAIKKTNYRKFLSEKRLIEFVSEKLLEGNVVGWFQGHCEFGARALGNRSILANPLLDGMKDRINRVIKKREGFRPFAPMVIKEKQKQYFDVKDDIPYMNQVVNVKDEYKNILKAVTHVDGTARVQTVYERTKMYYLLKEFELKSGYPVLLNTSFNVKDKTMVLTPKDAVDTFFDTEMDILVINNYVILKRNEKINQMVLRKD